MTEPVTTATLTITPESIEALQQMIREIVCEEIQKAMSNKPCCEGGPQWGHSWSCSTLP